MTLTDTNLETNIMTIQELAQIVVAENLTEALEDTKAMLRTLHSHFVLQRGSVSDLPMWGAEDSHYDVFDEHFDSSQENEFEAAVKAAGERLFREKLMDTTGNYNSHSEWAEMIRGMAS